jgi:3-hydroxy-9,10-secoandrosta-1,3,5(10)-triene-9,17-dione monooxygenase reductase component
MPQPASPTAPAEQAFDAREFRAALGSFVTGVTIITTLDAAGNPAGLTANSFNSVSLDPPMVLWSLALDSTSLEAFRQAGWWAVHVLAAGQEDLSNRFARRENDKFDGVATTPGPGGIPLLAGAAARFVCRAAFEYEGGDHAIFLGQVTSFERAGHPPLVYHQGRYGGVFPSAAKRPGADPSAALGALEAQGLATSAGGAPRLTAAGRRAVTDLAALAPSAGLSPHEEAALRHLLERLTQTPEPPPD